MPPNKPAWYECDKCRQTGSHTFLFSTSKAAIEHLFRYHLPFDFIEIDVDRGQTTL